MTQAKMILVMEGVVKGITEKGESRTVEIQREGMQYPDLISFFRHAQEGIQVKVGQHARIRYTLSDRTTSAGNPYKNGVTAVPTKEPSQQAEEEPPFPVKNATGAPQAERPVTPTRTASPPSQHRSWHEAYSQSKAAHDDQRASIESQTAFKEAMAQVRDLVTIEKLDPLGNIAVYQRLLTDLTIMGLAAIREARVTMKEEPSEDGLPF